MSDVFSALADANRRSILEHLVADGRGTPTELSDRVGVSRQAVSKHLGILASADLVQSKRDGRETVYSPTLNELATVSQWVSQVEGQWTHRLDMLRKVLGE